MRKPLIAGNWKMNTTLRSAVQLAQGIHREVREVEDVEILVCPPAIYLLDVIDSLADSNIKVGAQNLHWEDSGAFTGEVSGAMLKDVGCTYVIVGHSERRNIFGESNEVVSKKVRAALRSDLMPILCVGELLEDRERGATESVVRDQLLAVTEKLTDDEMSRVVIAYEPVWAIGTGRTATPEQANEVHKFIRKRIENKFGHSLARDIRIIYGGSVRPDNIKALMAAPDIDGVLVGGASLNVEHFSKIVKYRE